MLSVFILLICLFNMGKGGCFFSVSDQGGTSINYSNCFFIDSSQNDVFLARDSKLYLGVRKLDPAVYTQLEHYLEMKETMNTEHEYNKEIQSNGDLLIKYRDGKVVRLKWYENGKYILTFQDWDTKKFYTVQIEYDEENLETMRKFEAYFLNPLSVSLSMLGIIILYSVITKKLKKKDQLPEKIKLYPYTCAMIFDIVLVIMTYCTMIVLAYNGGVAMHFGWILLLAITHFMYHYWLDKQLPTLKGRLLFRICGIVYGYSMIVYLFVLMGKPRGSLMIGFLAVLGFIPKVWDSYYYGCCLIFSQATFTTSSSKLDRRR